MIGFTKNNVVYYVHGDHLGRPEVVTTTSSSKVWQAKNTAFARTVTLDSIGGFNVGFPGQYWDDEKNSFYNMFRDYEPSIGRYLQSDPIGLAGGINTYRYVGGNPVNNTDRTGLINDNGLLIFDSLGVTEDNCSVRTSNALERAGIEGASRPLPFAIGTTLDSNPHAIPTYIPQNGNIPIWVTDFNP